MRKVIVLVLLAILCFGVSVFCDTDDDAMQAGGARLEALQNNDGGWDWPLDDGNPNNASPLNTIGPIGMGLARAYWNSADMSFQAALSDTGALLLTKSNNFSPSDGYLATMLDSVFGGSTYRDHVMANFYGPLAAGTYDKSGSGTLYSTVSYVQLIRTARAGNGNLAEWDIGMGLVGAASCGASTTAWIDGVKAELNEHDSNAYYDVIGLAGALYGLALVGEDFDPTTGDLASASNLNNLGDILAGYQIDGGGFAWNANYVIANDGNESVQETAYAILALNQLIRSGYLDIIQGAADWLVGFQLGTGGWKNWDGGNENNEVTAEAMWGIHAIYVEDVYVSSSGHDMAFGYGAIPFATVSQAVSQMEGLGGTVYVAAGTYVEGPRIDILGDVSIVGAGAGATTMQPAGSTGSSGDDRAWFLVGPDITLNLSGITFDGTGESIHQAFRWKGKGSVTDSNFLNIIYSTYLGFGLVPFGGPVDVIGCSFENIGRVGVLYFGSGVAGSTYSGNTYIGKGAVDGLDYGVELGGGAVVTIQYSDIRGNTAVASSDGSTSAGILVTDYYGPGTAATIMFNTLANNTTGIAVGYLATDASSVVARYNSLFGNEWGIASTGPLIDAALNWWGDVDGPSGEGTGAGDQVSSNVIFSPWLGIDPDADPGTVGVQLTSPMLIIVDDIGPEPAGGYMNMAIDASNTLPGLDSIEVRHGTYDASAPITDGVNIYSEVGSAAHTTLTGAIVINASDVLLGRLRQGFTINGPVSVGFGVDASSIHINWNDIYDIVTNGGTGTLDATFNFWGAGGGGTVGAVAIYPILPEPSDTIIGYIDTYYLSPLDAIAFSDLLGLGLSSTKALAALDLMRAFGFSDQEAAEILKGYSRLDINRALRGAAGDYEEFLALLIGYGDGGGGGGSYLGGGGGGSAGMSTFCVGCSVPLQLELVHPITGEPITDAVVSYSVCRALDDGTVEIVALGVMTYDGDFAAYTYEIDTSTLEPGVYDVYLGTNDGRSRHFQFEVAVF